MSKVTTATPGVFYHGSPNPFLSEIRSGADLTWPNREPGKFGIYFTPNERYARWYTREWGRVYEVELITRNPIVFPADAPTHPSRAPKEAVAEAFRDARRRGHDCVIVPDGEEVIVFEQDQIRYLSRMEAPVSTCTPGVFYIGVPNGTPPCPAGSVFTQSRTFAEVEAGPWGRVFQAQLMTARPMHAGSLFARMAQSSSALARLGYDCIINDAGDVIALDAAVVRYRDELGYRPTAFDNAEDRASATGSLLDRSNDMEALLAHLEGKTFTREPELASGLAA
jgi:hypothetical protein